MIQGQLTARRWGALAVLGMAQLMVVLDATIVNIALPSAQRGLGMSDADRQWVITAYALAFGGLLLLGGRVCDLLGRRQALVIALLGFAAASVVGGAAASGGVLVAARALQGVFAALLAPAALALLNTIFSRPDERALAFGVYGALSGAGATVGLLAGGVLTEFLSWRWCLYVNVPIAVLALLAARWTMPKVVRDPKVRIDSLGAVLGCGGLVLLVYALGIAEHGDWLNPWLLFLFGLGVVLLGLFGWRQRLAANPLLPPRILADRDRAGALLAVLLSNVAQFGFFLFVTYYVQDVLGYSPVVAGLSFLPLAGGIVIGSSVLARRLLPRIGARGVLVPGLLSTALGMGWLVTLQPESGYLVPLLPAQILIGVGLGCAMMSAMSTATARVAEEDAGVAAASVNAAQQIGGSMGTALLNSIAISVAAAGTGPDAVVHGYTTAIAVAAGILVLAALVVAGMLPRTRAAEHVAG
ncbi:EmrB/QacA subfamily drug resistance transporter [Tamaricihabitans halophyticus]|uniref:EmrB/QacA subfamily drug resistance transporter n=1 Tax=Tamaricihabitans halophyticus TaxID=1262583 RepID=A0A4V2STB1_9PSEU|nr:MFS transporter [Tamaricihabitans halophyticus]TCP50086.1 EmrB/QacA subfamily drug resistance transporter [Tamaricihabitans halophyticus]